MMSWREEDVHHKGMQHQCLDLIFGGNFLKNDLVKKYTPIDEDRKLWFCMTNHEAQCYQSSFFAQHGP